MGIKPEIPGAQRFFGRARLHTQMAQSLRLSPTLQLLKVERRSECHLPKDCRTSAGQPRHWPRDIPFAGQRIPKELAKESNQRIRYLFRTSELSHHLAERRAKCHNDGDMPARPTRPKKRNDSWEGIPVTTTRANAVTSSIISGLDDYNQQGYGGRRRDEQKHAVGINHGRSNSTAPIPSVEGVIAGIALKQIVRTSCRRRPIGDAVNLYLAINYHA